MGEKRGSRWRSGNCPVHAMGGTGQFQREAFSSSGRKGILNGQTGGPFQDTQSVRDGANESCSVWWLIFFVKMHFESISYARNTQFVGYIVHGYVKYFDSPSTVSDHQLYWSSRFRFLVQMPSCNNFITLLFRIFDRFPHQSSQFSDNSKRLAFAIWLSLSGTTLYTSSFVPSVFVVVLCCGCLIYNMSRFHISLL